MHNVLRGRHAVAGDIFSNSFQIGFRFSRENDNHGRLVPAFARSIDSTRSKALATGVTRPASASARPRAIEASSAASRVSRSWINRTPSRSTSLLDPYRPVATSFVTNFSRLVPKSALIAMEDTSLPQIQGDQ